MKKLILFIIVLLVIGVGWFVFNSTQEVHAPVEEVKENDLKEEISFKYETSSISEDKESYSIKVSFPITEDSYVNETIDKFIKETVDQFRSEVEEFGPLPMPGRKYTLFSDFEFKDSTEYKTFVFLTSVDMGGAHPNHFFKTLTFNKRGEFLDIVSFVGKEFGEGDHFAKISELVQEKLKVDLGVEVSESSWIEDGAGSDPKNFQDFYVENDSIHFLFEPYSVAAYALSSREVEVRFDEIK